MDKTVYFVCVCGRTQSEAARHSDGRRTLDTVQQALLFCQQVFTGQLGGAVQL